MVTESAVSVEVLRVLSKKDVLYSIRLQRRTAPRFKIKRVSQTSTIISR